MGQNENNAGQPVHADDETAVKPQTLHSTEAQIDRPKLVPPNTTEHHPGWEPASKIDDDPARAIEQANAVTLAHERIHTHTHLLSVTEAKRAITAIDRFNNFYPEKICKSLDLLHRFDPDLRIAVGLEGSPVLYLHTIRADFAVKLLDIVHADELQANTGGGVYPSWISDGFEWVDSWKCPSDGTDVLIRAWWD